MNCSIQGCSETVVVHFVSARQGRCFSEEHLCERHGKEFIAQYHSVSYAQGNEHTGVSEFVHLDVELLAIYEGSAEQGIYLRDVHGSARFFMLIGMAEAWALSYNLKHANTPRPLTHRALSNTIAALGGQLQDVLVDCFDDNAKCYHAKLRIQQAGRSVTVDVRPSDAYNIAVLNAVPILIVRHIMTKNGQAG